MTLLMTLLCVADTALAEDSRSFTVIDPDDWAYTVGAVDDMAQDWGSTWTAEEGHVVTYGVVEDADESGIFYFATTRDIGGGRAMVGIFRYNTSTYGFERLMRIDDVADATWYVVGYDNGYVVYAETSGSYDRGACGEPIVSAVDGTDGALYRLPDTYSESWSEGASMYTAQDADVQTARDRQSACETSAAQ